VNNPLDNEHLNSAAPRKPGRRNVIVLGLVSMLNDMASEMAYPVIPLFLTGVLGAPATVVGVIEGVAEATANVLKLFSGWLSDRVRNRKRFVAAGYLLSALAKAALALSTVWGHVLGARFVDRFGKGVRTSARDALIAESVDAHEGGVAFGLHRALDTVGAVVGPLAALLLLSLYGNRYSLVFWIAAIPALLGVCLLLVAVREPVHQPHPHPLAFTLSVSRFGGRFRLFLLCNLLFMLGNSSDAFLLLRAQSLGASTEGVLLLYVAFNVVYASLSYPFGKLSDRYGKKGVLVFSFGVFALAYGGFAAAPCEAALWVLFPLYGVFMAMNEGVGKAYIAELVPEARRGTALGLFATLSGIAALASSVLAGFLWSAVGVPAPFWFGAACSATAGLLFAFFGGSREQPQAPENSDWGESAGSSSP